MAKRKKASKSPEKTVSRVGKIDKAIIDNFIALQRVQTNLSIKFDNLSEKIGKLLEVFEISAKSLADKDFKDFVKVNDEEVLEKLDELLEQNKIIAKGLIMVHERSGGVKQEIPSMQKIPEYRTIMPRTNVVESPPSSQRFNSPSTFQPPQSPQSSKIKSKPKIAEEKEESPAPSLMSSLPDMEEYTKSIAPPKES